MVQLQKNEIEKRTCAEFEIILPLFTIKEGHNDRNLFYCSGRPLIALTFYEIVYAKITQVFVNKFTRKCNLKIPNMN